MIASAHPRPHGAHAPVPVRPETIELIRVAVGDLGFALPLATVATILSPSALAARGDDSTWLGVVAARGGEIPIADTRTIFGMPRQTSDAQRLLVLRGSPPAGLLVDAVHGTTRLAMNAVERLSPLFGPTDQILTQSVAWQPDGTLDIIIDVPALRRTLHKTASIGTSAATDTLANQFRHPATGDELELRLDESDRRWRLPIDYIRQISNPRPPARLPRTSTAILGLLAWRREPIPLLDTARVLNLPPTDPTTLLVLGPASRPDFALLALTATSVLGVATPDSDAQLLDMEEIVGGLRQGQDQPRNSGSSCARVSRTVLHDSQSIGSMRS